MKYNLQISNILDWIQTEPWGAMATRFIIRRLQHIKNLDYRTNLLKERKKLQNLENFNT